MREKWHGGGVVRCGRHVMIVGVRGGERGDRRGVLWERIDGSGTGCCREIL